MDSQCIGGGEQHFYQNIGTSIDIVPGQWYAFETMATSDTQGIPFSGELKLWINGELKAHHQGVSLKKSANADSLPINGVMISSYYGAIAELAPYDQSVWYDNFVVSTQYIGPLEYTVDLIPPSAPSGLVVN